MPDTIDHGLWEQYWESESGFRVRHAAMRPGEYRAKSLFWIRVIGAIVVAWAVLSLALGAFVATQLVRDAKTSSDAAAASSSSAAYSDYAGCLSDPDTTAAQCDSEFPGDAAG
jgi:hypothetical protein